MNDNLPTWFIDIDGNINACSPLNNAHYSRFSHWEKTIINGYPILFAPEVIDFINDMSPFANIRWLTTWRADADRLFAPAVGLKKFPYDDSVGTINASGAWNGTNHLPVGRWWKQNVIMNHMDNNGSPFIWTEDDMISGVRKYIRTMGRDMDIDTCLITPHTPIGLMPEHLDKIEAFITKHN